MLLLDEAFDIERLKPHLVAIKGGERGEAESLNDDISNYIIELGT